MAEWKVYEETHLENDEESGKKRLGYVGWITESCRSCHILRNMIRGAYYGRIV